MIGRRRFGAVGLLALPYTLAFEVLGPLLQIAGYAIMVVLILLDQVSWWYAVAFFLVPLLVGQLQTAGAILIEEVGFRRYRNRDLMLLGALEPARAVLVPAADRALAYLGDRARDRRPPPRLGLDPARRGLPRGARSRAARRRRCRASTAPFGS